MMDSSPQESWVSFVGGWDGWLLGWLIGCMVGLVGWVGGCMGGKDGTNIRIVFEILNIRTFSCYSIFKNLQLYKQISLEYFHSCPPPLKWAPAILNDKTRWQRVVITVHGRNIGIVSTGLLLAVFR